MQWCSGGALFDTQLHKFTLINTVHCRSVLVSICACKCLFVRFLRLLIRRFGVRFPGLPPFPRNQRTSSQGFGTSRSQSVQQITTVNIWPFVAMKNRDFQPIEGPLRPRMRTFSKNWAKGPLMTRSGHDNTVWRRHARGCAMATSTQRSRTDRR